MRIITHALAMEVKLCLVVSISRADFKNAQSSKDAAQDTEEPDHAKCGELQSAFRAQEFGRPPVRVLNPQQES